MLLIFYLISVIVVVVSDGVIVDHAGKSNNKATKEGVME
jgi:hypothetical protein